MKYLLLLLFVCLSFNIYSKDYKLVMFSFNNEEWIDTVKGSLNLDSTDYIINHNGEHIRVISDIRTSKVFIEDGIPMTSRDGLVSLNASEPIPCVVIQSNYDYFDGNRFMMSVIYEGDKYDYIFVDK